LGLEKSTKLVRERIGQHCPKTGYLSEKWKGAVKKIKMEKERAKAALLLEDTLIISIPNQNGSSV